MGPEPTRGDLEDLYLGKLLKRYSTSYLYVQSLQQNGDRIHTYSGTAGKALPDVWLAKYYESI